MHEKQLQSVMKKIDILNQFSNSVAVSIAETS